MKDGGVPEDTEMVLDLRVLNRAVKARDASLIENAMENLAYQFGCLFEHLENNNVIIGNGHHMAQALSGQVKETLQRRWTKSVTNIPKDK